MKTLSTVSILIFFLGAVSLALAGNSSGAGQQDGGAKLKYVEFSQLGNPAEVLVVKVDAPRSLKNGEIRVRVLATPIHPSNLLQIAGKYGVEPALPSTPGSEGVGRVVETSAEVTNLVVGQLVLLAGGGTWRDEIVAPAANFIPLPDLGSPSTAVIEQLSMTTVNPLTALLMLTSFVELEEGDWLVQSAANSAVGGYVIQLAKQRGIKTVNVVRREGLAEEMMSKGADVVLIDGPDLADQIASATGNAPVSLAIDAVGGETFTRLAKSLGHGGTLVAYGVLSGKPATLNTAITIFNDIRIRGFWLSKWFETAGMKEKQAAFGEIIPLIASGALKADVDSRFTVDEIKQAVSRAAQRGRNGKVLIVPNPG
ncbi:alcohol dehydrogenase [Seongchinamella unica]|uniref:enoyl-[acyl-carrier-protein] reductase n=1 Tax=Seongchinamella unica TaxID=2547392 RepID=A0A4R5LTI8_9GAMM|nr:zinc-dependent alcohol dehydrogenase family protein [Seongchinamella unica]TDG14673.1 alcohol dehydrogenase [Seongchinamella unica]